MRLFCWNVNSLVPTVRNINLKYGSLAAFFAHLDADIVCLQEVKLPEGKLTEDLVVVEGYQSYWSCSQSKTGYSGVTTWARHGFAALTAEADPFTCEGCEKEGRVVVTDHGSFVLFNVYVPNAGDRPERARLPAKLSFLSALKERVDELRGAGRQVIIVGDLNIAAEARDVHGALNWHTMYHPSEPTALHDLMGPDGSDCCDTWRHLHPHTQDVFTVWNEKTSARAFNVGLRIDYALVSRGLLSQVVSCEVLMDLPPKWSDHAPLMLELNLTAPFATSSTTTPPAAETGSAAAAAGPSSPGQQGTQQQPEGHQAPQPQQPPECPMWQQLLRRFHDPSQRSIASMFKAAGRKKPAGQQTAPPTATSKAAAAAAPVAAAHQQAASTGAEQGEQQPYAGTLTAATGSAAGGPAEPLEGPMGTAGTGAATSAPAEVHLPHVTREQSDTGKAAAAEAGASVCEEPDEQQQQQAQVSRAAGDSLCQQLPRQPAKHQQLPSQQGSQAKKQQSQAPAQPATQTAPSRSSKADRSKAAAVKRKAPSSGAASAGRDAKQAKLSSFFARAPTSGNSHQP